MTIGEQIKFQFTRSSRSATRHHHGNEHPFDVSIHALLAERDFIPTEIISRWVLFQFTRSSRSATFRPALEFCIRMQFQFTRSSRSAT